LDWEEQLRQRAKEVALMTELGIAPAKISPTTVPSQEEEEADAERTQ
jgi:hypothetical protein